MLQQITARLALVFFLISLVSMAHAEKSGVESLSPELRALLSEEMLLVQEGMMAIIPAYSAGNTVEVASIAQQIKNSFILKRKLTEKQKNELHSKLPEAFLKLDEQFHYNAGMLQHAAEMQKQELIGFYFSQLSEACAGCHSMYALHKFPYLAETPRDSQHQHE